MLAARRQSRHPVTVGARALDCVGFWIVGLVVATADPELDEMGVAEAIGLRAMMAVAAIAAGM